MTNNSLTPNALNFNLYTRQRSGRNNLLHKKEKQSKSLQILPCRDLLCFCHAPGHAVNTHRIFVKFCLVTIGNQELYIVLVFDHMTVSAGHKSITAAIVYHVYLYHDGAEVRFLLKTDWSIMHLQSCEQS